VKVGVMKFGLYWLINQTTGAPLGCRSQRFTRS